MKTTNDEITQGLAPMFAEAKKNGLWFHCNYQDLWFSPEELKEYQADGKFRWGAVNWKLLNPSVQLEYLDQKIRNAIKERESFKKRMDLYNGK